MGRTSNARLRLMEAVLELIWTSSYGSTTVDLICEKAGVKKGSFYHFFGSKCDLAAEALAADWRNCRPTLDSLFSPTTPPLQRLRDFCRSTRLRQSQQKKRCGRVLGCPLFTLGAEVCPQEPKLRKVIQGILECHRKYLESAIRDAQAGGLVRVSDPAKAARMVFAYYEGLLTQARIQDSTQGLREMDEAVFSMLGVKATTARPRH
jgi:TetR/AcrR family transcriptional repressor of nem operon